MHSGNQRHRRTGSSVGSMTPGQDSLNREQMERIRKNRRRLRAQTKAKKHTSKRSASDSSMKLKSKHLVPTRNRRYSYKALSVIAAFVLLVGGSMLIAKTSNKDTKSAASIARIEFSSPVKEVSSLTSNKLDQVTSYIRRQFVEGSWRYHSAQLEDNVAQIYIQIPEKLSLTPPQQMDYIRHCLCPKGESQLWQLINPTQVRIHLFTMYKANSISITCD